MLIVDAQNISLQNQPNERLDQEGYLIDPNEWSAAFTRKKAQETGIELNSQHWRLIELIRDKYLRLGALPPMRSLCRSVGVDRSELKKQFGSCLQLWKIAGLPNPGEEAKAYMN